MHAETSTPARATLSACLIVKDEEQALPACLESLVFVDELIVVDSGSVDGTVQIARDHGARVVEQAWLGFPAQRNVALDHATCDWVLEVDADERVTDELRDELVEFLAQPPDGIDIAAIPRYDILVGHRLGPSAKYPAYGHRLIRRGAYRHDERRTVHEGFAPVGEVYPFRGEFEHELAATWSEAFRDALRYARLEAAQLTGQRRPVDYGVGIFVRPFVKFVYRLTVDGGWRDGWPGVVKIATDASTDAAVWLIHLFTRHAEPIGESGVAGERHYGSRRFGVGSPRFVGLALDARSARAARAWLAAAKDAGADVALVAPGDGVDAVRVRPLESRSPIAIIRAIDAEAQIRQIDALIPFGRAARVATRLVPGDLRGPSVDIDAGTPPHVAARLDRGAAS